MILAACTLSLLTACAPALSRLKAAPAPQTAFLNVSVNARFEEDLSKYPFHRVWFANQSNQVYDGKRIYVAPVDTSHVRYDVDWHLGRTAGRIASEQALASIAEYTRETFQTRFAEENYEVTTDEQRADSLILELALVELGPTDVFRNVVGTAAGAFIPGGGLISAKSNGSIAIEGALRDGKSGEVLFMFTDRERGKMAPFNFNDYTRFSHARAIVEEWAEQLVELCDKGPNGVVPDSLPITLLPL